MTLELEDLSRAFDGKVALDLDGASSADAHGAATHWIERLGLADRAGDRLEALSLGNQQRVQLAAALVHDPEVLILDEPFSGLDPIGVDVMAGVLQERAQAGAAVVFSSHQLELVERLCRQVVIIADGRQVAAGEVEALRQQGQHGRRVRVRVDADPAWARQLKGVQLVEHDDESLVFELNGTNDEQSLLHAAQLAGPVRHFSEIHPTLSDLFRHVVPADHGGDKAAPVGQLTLT